MKTHVRLALALAAIALAAPAAAQDRPAFGIGVGLQPFADTPVSDGVGGVPTIQIYLPIQIAPTLRLEPSFGLFTRDPDGAGRETSDFTLGVGLFYTSRVAPPVDLHLGARLKLNFASFEEGARDESGTDLAIAAAVAGEYYLAARFSLGVEAQLGLYQNGDVHGDDSGFFTTGLAFARVYF